MADLTRRAEAARRAADALLRATGGRAVLLRVCVPSPNAGTASAITDEIGLGVPAFADVELAPVVLRRARPADDERTGTNRWELLVSANAVARAAGTQDVGTCFAMFAAAEGIVMDGALLLIAGMSSSDMTGSPYVYRLQLQSAAQRLR